jgi:hypothetical protein
VSFKGISQTDTIKKIVLTDKVGREVIKDLVRGDANKKIVLLQEKQIDNLNNVISIKDSIIYHQKEYIDIQKQMIYIPKLIRFHSYLGAQTINTFTKLPSLYISFVATCKRINLGVVYSVQQYNTPNTNLVLEFKLF